LLGAELTSQRILSQLPSTNYGLLDESGEVTNS